MKTPTSPFTATKHDLLAIAKETAALKSAVEGAVTETVADWLAPQYAVTARRQVAAEQGPARLEILRMFVVDWALLRRSQQYSERLQIERERLDLARERTKERMEELFQEWSQDPQKTDRLRNHVLSTEERAARIREILRYPHPPIPATNAAADTAASQPPPSNP